MDDQQWIPDEHMQTLLAAMSDAELHKRKRHACEDAVIAQQIHDDAAWELARRGFAVGTEGLVSEPHE